MTGVLYLILLLLIVCMIDYGYGTIVRRRYQTWNETIDRDDRGLRAGYDEYTEGSGSTALLLVHGFGASPALYIRMSPALAQRGFACRAMRLPGFGEPMDVYARTDRRQWVDRVKAEAQALRRGHEKVWIVAHSMGCTVTIRSVLEEPEIADGLVLLAPLFEVSSRRSPILKPRQWFGIFKRLAHHTTLIENLFGQDAYSPEARAFELSDHFHPIGVYDQLYALIDDIQDRNGRITQPVLLVVSDGDRVIDPVAARHWMDTAGSHRKEIVSLGQAGHLMPLDYGWDTIVERMHVFITGQALESVNR